VVPTLRSVRESLVEISRRHSRLAHEVEDVAHDLVLSALRRGLALDGETFLQSAHGAARRHAAFLARSAGRRRAREASCAPEVAEAADDTGKAGHDAGEGTALTGLSSALRTTLFLLLQGLDKAELRAALGVSDTALRKRFQALRDHAPLIRPRLPVSLRTPTHAKVRRSQVALLPRLPPVSPPPRVIATTDPDGHGLIFAEVLTTRPDTATSDASTPNAGTHAKGTSCSTPRSRTSASSS
jgi:DNA-directed RNA polymerase specialized sigma24 family protein